MKPLWICVLGLLATGAMLASAGCRDESKQRRKVVARKGVAAGIDLANNRVSMKIRLEKTGEEIEYDGQITPETEVWINGVRKGLADVVPGDEIEVEAYRSGEGLDQKFVVTRVAVTRPQDWKSTQPPGTTRPAAPPDRAEALASPVPALPRPATTQPVRTAESPPPSAPAPEDVQRQRERLMTEIYTNIRERMDQALDARAELLRAGRPQTDPEVQNYERVIRRARNLLIEIGENVTPVDPPLLDEVPATRPAAAN